nr:hypothetical protein [Tanacetum cinerariifolium]
MADVNVNVPADQAPTMAPPTRTDAFTRFAKEKLCPIQNFIVFCLKIAFCLCVLKSLRFVSRLRFDVIAFCVKIAFCLCVLKSLRFVSKTAFCLCVLSSLRFVSEGCGLPPSCVLPLRFWYNEEFLYKSKCYAAQILTSPAFCLLRFVNRSSLRLAILLQSTVHDVYATVDSYETAKEIWERVRQMMKGFDIGEQEKKAKLFNEWEKLTGNRSNLIIITSCNL